LPVRGVRYANGPILKPDARPDLLLRDPNRIPQRTC
jgi:hypothetical protein